VFSFNEQKKEETKQTRNACDGKTASRELEEFSRESAKAKSSLSASDLTQIIIKARHHHNLWECI
jgi:hypothetical protein